MKDIRQSSAWARYLESMGWKIEKIDGVYVYLRKIPILGYFAKIQRLEKLTTKTVNSIENKYRPFQISIEPLKEEVTLKDFKLNNSPSLPTKTLQIDLTKSEKKILESFSQKTRYNVKLSLRKKTTVDYSSNILIFTKFWHENFERKRFPFFSQQKNMIELYKAFGKESHILLAKRGGGVISGLFILVFDKTVYYMYAASNNEGRKSFAPTLLTWEAIKLAKKLKCRIFDFDGIYDERFPIKTWKGFTKFKKGFGGKEIQYPGSYIKTRSIIKL